MYDIRCLRNSPPSDADSGSGVDSSLPGGKVSCRTNRAAANHVAFNVGLRRSDAAKINKWIVVAAAAGAAAAAAAAAASAAPKRGTTGPLRSCIRSESRAGAAGSSVEGSLRAGGASSSRLSAIIRHRVAWRVQVRDGAPLPAHAAHGSVPCRVAVPAAIQSYAANCMCGLAAQISMSVFWQTSKLQNIMCTMWRAECVCHCTILQHHACPLVKRRSRQAA